MRRLANLLAHLRDHYGTSAGIAVAVTLIYQIINHRLALRWTAADLAVATITMLTWVLVSYINPVSANTLRKSVEFMYSLGPATMFVALIPRWYMLAYVLIGLVTISYIFDAGEYLSWWALLIGLTVIAVPWAIVVFNMVPVPHSQLEALTELSSLMAYYAITYFGLAVVGRLRGWWTKPPAAGESPTTSPASSAPPPLPDH